MLSEVLGMKLMIMQSSSISLTRHLWDGRARQRTICDGRNYETGTQDDHDPGQRVHSVIGRVFPKQQTQQTRSDNGSNVLRSAQESGGGSHLLVRRLHIDRRLVRVRADSLGKAERQNQKDEERCSGTARNQYNAASGEKKTQGSEDQRITYAFHPSASESGESSKGGHGQCDEAGFRAAETRSRLQPLRKAVQHAVHHQIRRTVAQIRYAQRNVAPEHPNVEKWLFRAK